MTKTLERALAEIARLPEADQDRIGRELLAEVERLRSSAADESGRPATAADLEWLRARRVKRSKTASIDAGTLVSQMRDEEWR
jgi:hypothetical protein